MEAKRVEQGIRRGDVLQSAEADPRGELESVLNDLELQVQEDMMMLDGPLGGILAPHLLAVIRNSTDDLSNALARTRRSLAAAEATATRATGSEKPYASAGRAHTQTAQPFTPKDSLLSFLECL